MSGLLDRRTITAAFERLANKLRDAEVVGHIYIVGGAVIAMAYDAERITRDVDALIVDAHGPVIEAAAEVATELGLPASWLNEQASVYIPRSSDTQAAVIFDRPSLKVTGASPEFVVAMKVRAARPRDIEDLRLLMGHLGLTELDQAIALHDSVFPGEPLPQRTSARLRTYWPT